MLQFGLSPETVTNSQRFLFRFLYVLMLSLDANFRLKCKERGIKDVQLGGGYAYLVEEDRFKTHLAASYHAIEVRMYPNSVQNSNFDIYR